MQTKFGLYPSKTDILRRNDAVRSLEVRTPGWRPVIPVPRKLPEPFELDRFNVAVVEGHVDRPPGSLRLAG